MNKRRIGKIVSMLFWGVLCLFLMRNAGSTVMAADSFTNGAAVDDVLQRLGIKGEGGEDFETKKKRVHDFGVHEVSLLKGENDALTREKMMALCYGIMAAKEEIYRDNYTGGLSQGAYDQLLYYEDGSYHFKEYIEYVKKYKEYDFKEEYVALDEETIKKLEKKARVYGKYKPYKEVVVFLGRISDLKKFEKELHDAALRVFLSGVFIGESLGRYQTDRELQPKKIVSEAEFKETMERVFDKKKRFPMTEDGQLIRKTNLPVNAEEYEYILEAFPNEYYEVKFMLENLLVSGYDLKVLGTFEKPVKMKRYLRKAGKLNYEDFLKLAKYMKEAQEMKMNVDYRKIDNAWANKMVEYYLIRRRLKNEDRLEEDDAKEYKKKLMKDLKKYMRIVKKNHVIIEAKPMVFDPHSAFVYNDDMTFRTRMKYRVVSCDNFKKNKNYIILGHSIVDDFYGVPERLNNKMRIGKWMDGIYDLHFPEYEDRLIRLEWKHVIPSHIINPVRNIRKKKILKQFTVTQKDIKRFKLTEDAEGYTYWK